MKEATRFLIAFFLFPHLMCFPRSKFARLTAELADVRDLGKEAALYHFTFRFNPLHIGFCDSSSSSRVVVVDVVVDDLNSEEGELFTCVPKIFTLAPPDHLRLKLLTCASNTHLRPPAYSLAPPSLPSTMP